MKSNELEIIDERISEAEQLLTRLTTMPKKHKLIKTDFKCPECNGACLYNVDWDLYVCNRPLIGVDGEVKGSCGKFYKNKTKFRR